MGTVGAAEVAGRTFCLICCLYLTLEWLLDISEYSKPRRIFGTGKDSDVVQDPFKDMSHEETAKRP